MADNKQTTAETKAPFDPAAFVRETQAEIAKVTWPTRQETVMTTVMIVVMALVAGFFFLAVDSMLGYGISRLLGMKN